jgi:hypothetical protein
VSGVHGAACNTQNPSPSASLPPGASYLQPFAGGVSPARLYAASVSQVGSNLTAYDLLPICTTDFQTSALLKGLTSTPTLNYGAISLSDGAVVVANLSGVPIGKIINAGGGVSSDQRVNVTLDNAQLIQVDNDGVDSLIAEYVKKRGHGTSDNPRCLDVVQTQLKAGRMVIVTKGILTSSSATFAPDTTSGASCSSSVGTGGANAPNSACASVGIGKVVNFSVKAADGSAVNQQVNGAAFAIIPANLPI